MTFLLLMKINYKIFMLNGNELGGDDDINVLYITTTN